MPRNTAVAKSAQSCQPKVRWVNVSGCETAVHEYGLQSSPAILAVHGFRGTHFGLEPLATALAARGYRTVVPDLPGCGESAPLATPQTANEYGRWLVQLSAACGEPEVVLGHSFGTVVVAAALGQGLTHSRLVFLNPIAMPALETANRFGAVLAQLYYSLAGTLPPTVGKRLLGSKLVARISGAVMTKTKNPQLRRWIIDEHARRADAFTSREATLETYRASVTNTVSDFIPSFTRPTLIFGGKLDEISRATDQSSLAKSLPHAQFELIHDSGHLLPYEAPTTIARTLDRWVRDATVPLQNRSRWTANVKEPAVQHPR